MLAGRRKFLLMAGYYRIFVCRTHIDVLASGILLNIFKTACKHDRKRPYRRTTVRSTQIRLMLSAHKRMLVQRKKILASLFVAVEFLELDPCKRTVDVRKNIGARRFVSIFFENNPFAPARCHKNSSAAGCNSIVFLKTENRINSE